MFQILLAYLLRFLSLACALVNVVFSSSSCFSTKKNAVLAIASCICKYLCFSLWDYPFFVLRYVYAWSIVGYALKSLKFDYSPPPNRDLTFPSTFPFSLTQCIASRSHSFDLCHPLSTFSQLPRDSGYQPTVARNIAMSPFWPVWPFFSGPPPGFSLPFRSFLKPQLFSWWDPKQFRNSRDPEQVPLSTFPCPQTAFILNNSVRTHVSSHMAKNRHVWAVYSDPPLSKSSTAPILKFLF